jgi:predicted transcriptional regulator
MYDGVGVFENKSRKMIYNYISSHPGASFGEIKKVFEINKSTLKYHLHYLEKSKKIYSKREGRRRCYYNCKSNEYERSPLTELDPSTLPESQLRILDIIKENPGITNEELLVRTRLNPTKLNYNIHRLGELNFIWMVENDGQIGYEYITGRKFRQRMLNRLLMKFISKEIDEETFNKIMKKLETLDLDEILK